MRAGCHCQEEIMLALCPRAAASLLHGSWEKLASRASRWAITGASDSGWWPDGGRGREGNSFSQIFRWGIVCTIILPLLYTLFRGLPVWHFFILSNKVINLVIVVHKKCTNKKNQLYIFFLLNRVLGTPPPPPPPTHTHTHTHTLAYWWTKLKRDILTRFYVFSNNSHEI